MKAARVRALVAALLLSVAACTSTVEPSVSEPSRGPLTWLMGEDDARHGGDQTIAAWNRLHPDQPVTIKLLPDNVTDMHEALVGLFSSKSSRYDLISGDSIWVAEFAEKGWVDQLNRNAFDTSSAFAGTVEGMLYRHGLYGVPWLAGVGSFYYRSDLVPVPPITWAEMISICAKHPQLACYDGPFKPYEGLTVHVAEAIYSAGGQIIDSAGRVVINSPESLRALEFLNGNVTSGRTPGRYLLHDEGTSLEEFRQGRVLFLRGWNYFFPYFQNEGSKVKGRVGITVPLGSNTGGAGVLAMTAIQLNRWGHHKATAHDFMRFALTYPVQRSYLEAQTFPVNRSVYSAPDALKAHPEIAGYLRSYLSARPRPVIPRYADASEVIFTEVSKMLRGLRTPAQALAAMDGRLSRLR